MTIFRWIRVRRKRSIRSAKTTALLRIHSTTARVLVHERLVYWNQYYGFTYHRVSIRAQTTRWGSCSSKGNLNFNYRIVDLPVHLVDYLIVHELCHLQQMNHGPAFWSLVAQTIPDYRTCRSQLKSISL